MKKIFVLIITILSLTVMSTSALAAKETYTEGTLYYTVDNGSITITGCFGKDKNVEVPNQIAGYPVNIIATGAFKGNKYVKSVVLPDTITTIQEGAFDAGITVTQKTTSSNSGNSGNSGASGGSGGSDGSGGSGGSSGSGGSGASSDSEYITIVDGSTSSTAGSYDEAEVILDEEENLNGNSTSSSSGDSTAADKMSDSGATHVSTVLFIIIGIVVVVGAVVTVIVVKKKKN